MPLLFIGLFLLTGILVYAIYTYVHPDEDSQKSPGRRESERRRASRSSDDDAPPKVLYFPTSEDVEVEKRKRDI